MKKFDELGLDTDILMAVYENGFVTPTEIQEKSIPLILEGSDFVGKSETGSGKTLAYLLPAIQKINADIYGTQVLIICPTRELSLQVSGEVKKMLESLDSKLHVVSLNGGMDFDRQIRALKKGSEIVVGTIGRICDHINRRTLKLANLTYLVLDEADEMLKRGFREDIEKILKVCPLNIQKILFSATFPDSIKNIISKFLKNPKSVEIGSQNNVVQTVKQYFIYKKDKMQMLKDLLTTFPDEKIIIFANTKLMVEKIFKDLRKTVRANFIHGDIMQNERHVAITEFKTGFKNVLVSTDVAGRGIDIPDIFMVINFELPQEIEYYIHRVGRTARAGKSGIALTLIHNVITNRKILELSDILKTPIKEVVLSEGKLFETEYSYVSKVKPEGMWEKGKNKDNKKESSKKGSKVKNVKDLKNGKNSKRKNDNSNFDRYSNKKTKNQNSTKSRKSNDIRNSYSKLNKDTRKKSQSRDIKTSRNYSKKTITAKNKRK